MSYPIPTGGIVQLTIEQVFAGQRMLNVLHYRLASDQSVPDGEAAILDLIGQLYSGDFGLQSVMLDIQSSVCQHVGVKGQYVHPGRRPYVFSASNAVGDMLGTPLPPANSAVVTKLGTQAGRGKNGRMSIGGLTADSVVNGSLTADAVAKLNLIGAQLDETFPALGAGGGTWEPVLWNPATPTQFNTIEGHRAQFTVRTVSRRVVGRGI